MSFGGRNVVVVGGLNVCVGGSRTMLGVKNRGGRPHHETMASYTSAEGGVPLISKLTVK